MTDNKDNEDLVRIDPRCIQEALRMYLQPIKDREDDPTVDFYAIYQREAAGYDAERMKKYNDDLDITLIFAALFSAVGSAFIIDVQSKLEPDSGERSEAYLRAILLTLNPSLFPDESPAGPLTWKGPPAEIITTLDLLYASLLMSLLAAFIAMLGKQWLNRYIRHTGGSVIERSGDRQRKFDGMRRWRFTSFIEILPVILQIALLLLASGLSRYLWAINISVARVLISFTVLGFLFYIGIVVAGSSSYECPFQTPIPMALRYWKDDVAIHVIPLISATRGTIRKLTLSNITQLSMSRILLGIRHFGRDFGYQVIILLLRTNQAFHSAKERLVQGIRRFRRAVILPIVGNANRSLPPRNSPGLLMHVRNPDVLRKQNTSNASCVSWILRGASNPKAIDSALRLAGTIQWFDGGLDHEPPYDLIVSHFEACFDCANQLYPGMRDRAYFSARAILRIYTGARVCSDERASKYLIPTVPKSSSKQSDPDLHHVLHMLKCNGRIRKPTLNFPRVGENTRAYCLWTSNLIVDLTRVGPNPNLESYQSYLSAAVTDQRAIIADTLLVWYMLLGGQAEEETFRVIDKSGSVENILSHLSPKVTAVIADENSVHCLVFLLEFLAAWKNRPTCLSEMACEWCSALLEVVGKPRPGGTIIDLSTLMQTSGLRPARLRPQDLSASHFQDVLPRIAETGFSGVRVDHTPDAIRRSKQHRTPELYAYLLHVILEVGFRLAGTRSVWGCIPLNYGSHRERMLEDVFSSDDDEIIADAVTMWIMNGVRKPLDSFARYFAKRMEREASFSERLRELSLRVIERTWHSGYRVPGPETVLLLNRLDIGVHDAQRENMPDLLAGVLRSPAGLEGLSPSYWRTVEELIVIRDHPWTLESRDVEVMRLLRNRKADDDWEKLEIWMLVVWACLRRSSVAISPPMEEIQQTTLELLSRRSTALPKFKGLCDMNATAELLSPMSSPDSPNSHPRATTDRAVTEKLQCLCGQIRLERPTEDAR